jgi:hypothetical protein
MPYHAAVEDGHMGHDPPLGRACPLAEGDLWQDAGVEAAAVFRRAVADYVKTRPADWYG